MVSTLSCFLLFGIIILTNGNHNFYKERSEGLIQILSKLKAKYGLNFVNIEGTGSLLNKYKESHPKLHNIELGDPHNKQTDNPTDMNNMEKFNLLVAMNKFKAAPSLRICRKEPKNITCSIISKYKSEEKKSDEECNSNSIEKKRKKHYYRAGDNKKHFSVDETAKLLNDLEKLLAKNGKYKLFLGCVGDMCGRRSNKDRYDEDKYNTKVEREYLGCTGDRCGGRRDEDDDTDVRRRF